MSDLAPVLQEFFTRRLVSQRDASPATITAYRDTFRLLIGFASARSGKSPSALGLADLDAPAITAFLQYLQDDRGNSVRTRNARLAAVHSLFAYAALRHPEHGALIQRVLAIPGKRRDRADVTYLTPDETSALLTACDQETRTGRRDHAMLALAVQAGLRVSELTSLTCADIRVQAGPHVHCTGKGRRERDTPLLPAVVRIMKAWLAERGGQPGDPLFPGPSGQRLSRDAVERRVKLYHQRASAGCPSLAAKHVTVHTLRHSAAMRLLLAGVDITVIALWLGHESLTSLRDSALSAAYGRRIPYGPLTWDFCFRSVMMSGSGLHPEGAGLICPCGAPGGGPCPRVRPCERRRAPWLWEITGYHTL